MHRLIGPLDREIWRLSLATFVALVSEPALLLADAAIVGHLGTTQLAGLGIASAILGTLASLCIFLAYGTTGAVARLVGTGDTRRALTQGFDGLWLAVALGVVLTAVALPLSGRLVALFGPSGQVAIQAGIYLRIALLGTTPMLLMLAAVGILRGVRDMRTPLLVAVVGNLVNIVLNLVLVYGLDLGIAGSAIGTVLAQTGSAVVLIVVLIRVADRHGSRLSPDLVGIRRAAHAGVPLIVRTLLLRAALLMMTLRATSYGDRDLAAMQLALTLWSFLAFALDALAISAQTLVGHELGAQRPDAARALTIRLTGWGVAFGVLTGLLLVASAPHLGGLFTNDPHVIDLLAPTLLVMALSQPIAGVVFVLDGILIGAGDAVYLAWGHAAVLVCFAPLALIAPGLTWLWIAFGLGFMATRAVMLLVRARGDRWMLVGAPATT